VNRFRWSPLFLTVVLLTGCTSKPSSSIPSAPVGPTGSSVPSKSSKPPDRPIPVTLESLLQEAPSVPLTKLPLTWNKLALTIDAPEGAKVAVEEGGEVRVLTGDIGVLIKPWSRGLVKADGSRKFLLETPVVWVSERTDRQDDVRYSFVTKITSGPLELGVTFTRPLPVPPVLGTRAEVALMLKCARTLTLTDSIPSDPAQALMKLGAEFTRSGATVNLGNSHATGAMLALLAKLPGVKDANLTWMVASGSDLAPLASMKQLESATFDNSPVLDEGLTYVGQLAGLRLLDLEKTGITSVGLANLGGLNALRKLKLDRNDLHGPGVKSLAKLATLEELFLRDTNLNNDALKAIGELKRLKFLSLEDNPIGDAGLAHLGNLGELEELEFDGTAVSDAGLAALEKLKSLKKLWVKKTKVTAAGIKKLKTALPAVDIRSDF
jgi:Leucine Rich repeat